MNKSRITLGQNKKVLKEQEMIQKNHSFIESESTRAQADVCGNFPG